MIIPDLNYLEVAAEASTVVGGTGKKKNNPLNIKLKLPQIVVPVSQQPINQNNVAVVTQIATAESAAVAEHGDAKSSAVAQNVLNLNQANVVSP